MLSLEAASSGSSGSCHGSGRLVWGKFAFSATGCFLGGEFLAISAI